MTLANLIFDRSTLLYSGQDRAVQPFEISIDNIKNLEQLTKVINYIEQQPKKIEGVQVYLLPQEDLITTSTITKRVEQTVVTDAPVYVTEITQLPLFDENGNQVSYYQQFISYEQVDTGEVDDENNPIFETVEVITISDTPTLCWITEEVQTHKTNENGELLYLVDVDEEIETVEPQSPIEILENDERYVDSLELAYEDVPKTRVAQFSTEPHLFSHEDVAKWKEANLHKGSLWKSAILIEQMDEALFDESVADFSYDKLSIPVGGFVQTLDIPLPSNASIVGLYMESGEGLTVFMGNDDDSQLIQVDSNKEVYFTNATTSVFIRVENNTDKRIDILNLGILV